MRLPSVLGAAALLVAACGGGSTQTTQTTQTTQATQTTQTTTAPTGHADAVPDFLDFSAETVRGDRVEGADYAGQDLVLWFWAPW